MAKYSSALVLALILLMVNHSAFAARNMQMSSIDNKNTDNVVDATRNAPTGDHAKHANGLKDNKNLVFGGVGSYGGIGGGAGIVGPLGGIGSFGGVGVGSGIGGVGLLPLGGVAGAGGVGGVGGGVGGIVP